MNTKELKEYMNDIKSRMEEDYPNLEINRNYIIIYAVFYNRDPFTILHL